MARVYIVIILVGFAFVDIRASVLTGNKDTCIAKNVALNKPAMVSSKYTPNSYASLAVDGDLTQRYIKGGKPYCIHTTSSADNWWQVDLLQIYNIERIKLFNRQDCCAKRARQIEILVGESLNNLTKVGFVETMGSQKTINITKTKGRYVKLVQTVTDILNICEVEVYAESDPCCNNPCQNGGICSTDISNTKGYTCACDIKSDYMYAGDNCGETWIKLPVSPTYKLVPRM